MISSVPYVPPDTMKNVAATSGQSVSLAMDFFAVGIVREGYRAGSDKELNFYSRPPKRTSLSRCGEASSQLQNTRVLSACKQKMHASEYFFSLANRTFVLLRLALVPSRATFLVCSRGVNPWAHARLHG